MNREIDYNALANSLVIAGDVRRHWMRLNLRDQAKVIAELEIPVQLPTRIGRFDPKMQKAYADIFAYVKDAMDVFDETVVTLLHQNEKLRFNQMLSGIERRHKPRK